MKSKNKSPKIITDMAGWKDRSYFYQISVEDNKLFLFEIVFFFTKLRRNQSRNIYDLDNSVVILQMNIDDEKSRMDLLKV